MNRRTAIILAIKAVILAEGAGCTVDEAIRYLVAVCITKEAEHVRISIMAHEIGIAKKRKLTIRWFNESCEEVSGNE